MKINLSSIQNLDLDDILVLIENEDRIKICIPKTSVLFFSPNFDVAIDYLYAAYVAYHLNKYSQSIGYSGGSITKNEDIEFDIVPNKNITGLAETIIELSQAFIDDENFDNADFFTVLEEFAEENEKGEIVFPEFLKRYFIYRGEEGNYE